VSLFLSCFPLDTAGDCRLGSPGCELRCNCVSPKLWLVCNWNTEIEKWIVAVKICEVFISKQKVFDWDICVVYASDMLCYTCSVCFHAVSGYGRSSGGIACLIYNNHPTSDIVIAYQDVIPWYLRVYYHTLKTETFSSVPQQIDAIGAPLQPCMFAIICFWWMFLWIYIHLRSFMFYVFLLNMKHNT